MWSSLGDSSEKLKFKLSQKKNDHMLGNAVVANFL